MINLIRQYLALKTCLSECTFSISLAPHAPLQNASKVGEAICSFKCPTYNGVPPSRKRLLK